MTKPYIIGGILFLLVFGAIAFLGVKHLRNKEDYDALSGRMVGIQKALIVYSNDHGGSGSKLVLPPTLNDLFNDNYLSKDDFWYYIDKGQLEYRGSVERPTVQTPLIRARTKSGKTYWCSVEGPINKGEGW